MSRRRKKVKLRGPAPRDPLQVNLRRVVWLILAMVIIPMTVLTGVAAGYVFAQERVQKLVLGVLVVCFAASVITGAVLLMILAGRGARLARVQETFLSHMGHELLTPLAGISLHTQILESSGLPDEAQASVQAIGREVRRLHGLVERILQWRQIRSKKHLYRREATTPGEVISRVLARVPQGAQVVSHVGDPNIIFTGDPEALSEAVANMMLNALKYAGHAGPVELDSRRFQRVISFAVSDRGPGLPEGPVEMLFEPFHRQPPGDGADPGGTGLGLTIARQIALDHGGRIGASNRPGGGARFMITIPAPERG